MKKTLRAFLLIVIMLLPATGLAETMYVNTANHKGVNLREEMSTDSDILCVVPYGRAVEVLDTIDGSSWLNCAYNGYYGYIMARYLSYDYPDPVPAPTKRPSRHDGNAQGLFSGFEPVYRYATVVPSTPGGFVNMRWAPSKQQPVFNIYYAGSQLEVLYGNSAWCQVFDRDNMIFGYMMRAFLNLGDGISNGDGFGVTQK